MRDRPIDVTRLLREWSEGDLEALDKLMPMVIQEVRDLAKRALANEAPGHTLQPTALVNEVYLRLTRRQTFKWRDRRGFFAVLAELIRRILIEHARRRNAVKRGGGVRALTLDELGMPSSEAPTDLLELDEALERLQVIDPRRYEIVRLRFFVGLSHEEVAQALEISQSTARRKWKSAKLWLQQELKRNELAEATAR